MEFQKDPKTASDIAKYEAIQITNGAVVLRNRLGPRVSIEQPAEAR